MLWDPLHVLFTPYLYPTTLWLSWLPWRFRHCQACPGFPAQLPHPSLVARAMLGMFTASQEGTPGHVPAGGSQRQGTLG